MLLSVNGIGIFHRLSALKRPGSGVNSQYRQTRIQRHKINLLIGRVLGCPEGYGVEENARALRQLKNNWKG